MEETVAAGMWPWITLIAAIAGFFLGMYFGKPRALAGWGNPCNQPCNCGGINCSVPAFPAGAHWHCPNQATETATCAGKCTNTAGPGHRGLHLCSHGHNF